MLYITEGRSAFRVDEGSQVVVSQISRDEVGNLIANVGEVKFLFDKGSPDVIREMTLAFGQGVSLDMATESPYRGGWRFELSNGDTALMCEMSHLGISWRKMVISEDPSYMPAAFCCVCQMTSAASDGQCDYCGCGV